MARDLYNEKVKELFPRGPAYSQLGRNADIVGDLNIRNADGTVTKIGAEHMKNPAVRALVNDHFGTSLEELTHGVQHSMGDFRNFAPLTPAAKQLDDWVKSEAGLKALQKHYTPEEAMFLHRNGVGSMMEVDPHVLREQAARGNPQALAAVRESMAEYDSRLVNAMRMRDQGQEFMGLKGKALDRYIDEGLKLKTFRNLHSGLRDGLDPKAVDKLSRADLQKLDRVADADFGPIAGAEPSRDYRKAFGDLVKQHKDPETLKRIADSLGQVDGNARRAMVDGLSQMNPKHVNKFLQQTIDGKPAGEVLGDLMRKMPAEGQDTLGKMLKRMDPTGAKNMLEE